MKLFSLLFVSIGIVFANFSVATPAQALDLPYNLPFLCINTAGSVAWPQPNTVKVSDSSTCPTGYNRINVSDISSTERSVCVARKGGIAATTWVVLKADSDLFGVSNCKKYEDPALNYTSLSLKQISGAPGSTPPTQNPPTQNPPTQNPPTQNPPPGGGTTTGNPGDCGEGFTAKGPLCIPNNPFEGTGGAGSCTTLGCVASKIISYLLLAAGIIAVIFVIIGGYYYMTARGNDAQALSGRKTLVNALIGLVIVILSFLIVQVATNFITKGS